MLSSLMLRRYPPCSAQPAGAVLNFLCCCAHYPLLRQAVKEMLQDRRHTGEWKAKIFFAGASFVTDLEVCAAAGTVHSV